jgi:hypothetical protein
MSSVYKSNAAAFSTVRMSGQAPAQVGIPSHVIRFVYASTLTKALPISNLKRSTFDCRVCKKSNSRQQELDRHYQTFHLPCWIFCPLDGCNWRGGRTDDFNKHWNTHQYDQKPAEEQYHIYNIKLVLDMIKDQGEDFSQIVQFAISFVGERALELGRQEWLTEPWGYSQDKQARRVASHQ